MSEGVILLLEQARAIRERGKHAERLAGNITTRDVVLTLLAYAQALDRLAVEAEERAFALIESPAKTQSLVDGIRAMRDGKGLSKPPG